MQMAGFEHQPSGVESNRLANCATPLTMLYVRYVTGKSKQTFKTHINEALRLCFVTSHACSLKFYKVGHSSLKGSKATTKHKRKKNCLYKCKNKITN